MEANHWVRLVPEDQVLLSVRGILVVHRIQVIRVVLLRHVVHLVPQVQLLLADPEVPMFSYGLTQCVNSFQIVYLCEG